MKPRSLGLLALVAAVGLGAVFLRAARRGHTAPGPARDPRQIQLVESRSEPLADPREPLEREPVDRRPPSDIESTEPIPTAPPPSFPTGVEVLVSPGTIEGLVLRGGEPVGGGEAWLVRNGSGDSRWCAETRPDDGDVRMPVGADGIFRFFPVATGEYCAGVDVEPGLRRARFFRIVEGASTRRWVIALGSAEIRGHVWGEDGFPAGDVPIRFSQVRRLEPTPTAPAALPNGSTSTDQGGSYRLRGLDPGTYAVEAFIGGAPGDLRGLSVELGPDEVKTVDFGSPRVLPVWSGRLLTSTGGPLSFSTGILLENRVAGTTLFVRSESDGSFRSELQPGAYSIKVLALREWLEVGELPMGDQDLVRDIRFPGACVTVTVRYVGTKGDPDAVFRTLMVFLSDRASKETLAMAQPGADLGYHFFGVPTGEYEVWTTTSPLAGQHDETFPLVVREGEAEVRTEITVGDP